MFTNNCTFTFTRRRTMTIKLISSTLPGTADYISATKHLNRLIGSTDLAYYRISADSLRTQCGDEITDIVVLRCLLKRKSHGVFAADQVGLPNWEGERRRSVLGSHLLLARCRDMKLRGGVRLALMLKACLTRYFDQTSEDITRCLIDSMEVPGEVGWWG